MVMNAVCKLFPHARPEEVVAQLSKRDAAEMELHHLRKRRDHGVRRVA